VGVDSFSGSSGIMLKSYKNIMLDSQRVRRMYGSTYSPIDVDLMGDDVDTILPGDLED